MKISILGRSGGHNRLMSMSNNDAEKHGAAILNKGAGLMDKMRSNKQNWSKDHNSMDNQRTKDRKTSSNDNNGKRRKFMKPDY